MIRASGGKAVVKVRKQSYPPGSMRAWLLDRLGAWRWEVPAPKGHPRTPKLETLRGFAHTQEHALQAGLNRLTEIYGGKS